MEKFFVRTLYRLDGSGVSCDVLVADGIDEAMDNVPGTVALWDMCSTYVQALALQARIVARIKKWEGRH
jgi:hypothetical protein